MLLWRAICWKIYFFREFARSFRETSHFWDIEMFCFREMMLPLKYVIRTIVVSEDLNLLFSGHWDISFLRNCNTSILGRLKCVTFRRLKMCHFRESEMCHIREMAMCHFREIATCFFWKIEMCYFQETEMYHFREMKIFF